ncbi:alpha/beta fold hydrolase [Luteipulveratus mongoliensis]|uniref:alpha/beta fold hydrolase n=1 Tax=Luteipulveratus mongoliensis TaxID=571913 RepID=UPI0006991960|nr:alpha/beta fold hydrolase [Luteipulveratus mongoliensis]
MTRHSARFAALGAMALFVTASATACQSDDPSPSATGSASSSAPGIASGEPNPKSADLAKYTSQKPTWDEKLCPKSMASLTLLSNRTDCAKVTAPKDYTDPKKGDITLLVARTKGKAPNSRILFTNPGGPGGPAARFSALVSQLSPLGKTHDVIGVDPRGTGESTPVSCEPAKSHVSDDRDQSPAAISDIQSGVKKAVDDCVAKHGDYLPYITTDNTARDQDLVRQILGADKVDYYGVSAGTWLGARYATLFPQHVGRFVLDSNTNFTGLFSDSFGTQPMSFQRRWDQQFLPWAGRHDTTYHLGKDAGTVKASYERIRKAASEKKLDLFTPNIIDHVMAQQLYGDEGFRSAAQLLSLLNSAANGDKAALEKAKRSAVGGGAPEYTDYREDTTFMAVTCNDTPWSKDANSYAETAKKDGPKYPLIGYDSSSPCAYWPYTAPQIKVDLKGAPPMMMVQTELDPATAYEGAIKAHQDVSANTRFLSVDNQGNHGALVGTTNGCVSTAGYDFLTKGKLIAKDSVCPAVPLTGEKQVYEVGTKIAGDKLPTADAYAKDKPSLAQQILQELLQMLVDATRPPTR